MAQRTLDVCIGERGLLVGTLWFEAQGSRQFSRFQYADSWLSHPIGFPLAPSLPLSPVSQFFRAEGDRGTSLPSAIADTAPDSWGRNIIRKDSAATRRNAEPPNELDYLLAVDDFSRLGALRFRETGGDGRFLSSSPEGKHEIPPILKLRELNLSIDALERNEPMTAHALRRLRQVGSALGGARPKCSVIDADGSLLIAKFTSRQDTENVEAMEVSTLKLAARCGIETPDARIDHSQDLPVALIRRFDRGTGRRPYISAQTFLAAPDALSGTYVDLVEMMRRHSDNPRADIRQLFQRVAFTILVSNVDDHLKNHGFRHIEKGRWRLSPLFDVNPSPGRHRELKTPISQISGSEANIEVLVDHYRFFDMEQTEASAAIGRIATEVNASWQSIGSANGLSSQDITDYKPAFEHAQMEKALTWASTGSSIPKMIDRSRRGKPA